ncbi:MAG: acyltransferase family protein [Chthoniobacterales bacterium]
MSEKDESFPSTVTRESSARVFGLDALRAAAILFVVLTHSFVVLYPHMPSWFGLLGHGGFYGVELFFVLSGFLIGRILLRREDDLRRNEQLAIFYLRRWFRTLPLFWLFLLVNVVLEISLRGRHLSASEILTHGFFLRNFAAFHLSFFPESWSLAIEEWFYLLFPAALWAGLRLTRRFEIVFLATALGFLLFSTIARMFSAPQPEATWSTWQRMIVIHRFDGLMFGVLAAWLSLRHKNLWQARPKIVAVLGIVLLLAMYATLWKVVDHRWQFGDDNYFARTFRFTLVSLGFAFLLPLASAWRLRGENFLSTSVRRIALWSYALYLVHIPVFQLVTPYIFRDWETSALSGFASFVLQLTLAITLSALLYRFYESRCTHLRERVAPALARMINRQA